MAAGVNGTSPKAFARTNKNDAPSVLLWGSCCVMQIGMLGVPCPHDASAAVFAGRDKLYLVVLLALDALVLALWAAGVIKL